MPQHKSCKKRMRTSAAENAQNRAGKSALRTAMKKVLTSKSRNEAEPLVREATSTLDRLVQKKIIHRNKAAHSKSRIDLFLNKLPA